MSRLLRAELLKLRTTRLPWVLLAIAVGLGALVTWLATWRSITAGTAGALAAPGTVGWYRTTLNDGNTVETFALVLGVVVMTGEFRHGTITSAFLAEPRRARLVGAKLLASLLAGAVYALVTCLVVLGVAAAVCAAEGIGVGGLLRQVPRVWGGLVAATALLAVFGAGVGALLRNQVAALVVSLTASIVVYPIVIALFPEVGRWLPDLAADALSSVALGAGGPSSPAGNGIRLLSWWAGGLVLAGYGLLFAAVGSVTAVRRDIT